MFKVWSSWRLIDLALNSTLPSRQTHHGHTENAVAEKFESKKGHFCKVLTLAAATEESFMITNGGRLHASVKEKKGSSSFVDSHR